MNAQIANLKPLSPALQGPFPANLNHPARRQFVGNVLLRMEALVHFNQLLARLQHFPLHRDQVATASRELAKPVNDQRQPVGIVQRLQWIDAVARMVADASWPTADQVIVPARLVLDYTGSERRLLPRGIPQIGRLDDAILVDAAWPQLPARSRRPCRRPAAARPWSASRRAAGSDPGAALAPHDRRHGRCRWSRRAGPGAARAGGRRN